VREPVPFLVGATSAPTAEAPAPIEVAVEPAPTQSTPAAPPSGEPGAPRRAGWWAKRVFGEKT
jgi:ribonuclease E